MVRIIYYTGQIIGNNNIKYIKEAEPRIQPSGQIKRMALFECSCGSQFIAQIDSIKRGDTVSCGCALLNFANSRKIKYIPGQYISGTNIQFIEDTNIKAFHNRCGIFKCYCGKIFIAAFCNIKNKTTTSCGCFGDSGYKKDNWINRCNHYPHRRPCLYLIEIKNENEHFIKIGLACNGIKYRYISKRDMPYQYSAVFTIHENPSILWDIESHIKKRFKKYKYKPQLKFNGHTECFSLNSLLDIKNAIIKLFYMP